MIDARCETGQNLSRLGRVEASLTACQEEFETILQERNVVSSLNDLDRLVDEARKRKLKAESESNGGPVQAPTP